MNKAEEAKTTTKSDKVKRDTGHSRGGEVSEYNGEEPWQYSDGSIEYSQAESEDDADAGEHDRILRANVETFQRNPRRQCQQFGRSFHRCDSGTQRIPEDTIQDRNQEEPIRIVPGRLVIVEPVIILYILAAFPMKAVFEQYFLRKVGHGLGVDYDHLNTTQNASFCDRNHDEAFLQRESVQAEAARWMLYISVTKLLPGVIANMILAALSDHHGRRICFILPPIGSILSTSLYLLIYHFNLPTKVFFMSSVESFFGSTSLMYIGAFAYLADTVSKKWLAVRMTILQLCSFVTGGLGQLAAGYFIKATGYFWPAVCVLCPLVLTLFYAIFFIPETIPINTTSSYSGHSDSSTLITRESQRMYLKDYCTAVRLFYQNNGTGRHWKISLLSSSYFVYKIYSVVGVFTLFLQNVPLCWDSVMIGYYQTVATAVHVFGTMAGLGLKRWLAEHWLIVLSNVSSIMEDVTLLLAYTSVLMFFVPVVGFCTVLAEPMMRATLSGYVRSDEQASLFAGLYCMSAVCELVGTLIGNNVYAATLLWYEGTVFIISIVVKVVSLSLVLLFIFKTRGDRRQVTEEKGEEETQS